MGDSRNTITSLMTGVFSLQLSVQIALFFNLTTAARPTECNVLLRIAAICLKATLTSQTVQQPGTSPVAKTIVTADPSAPTMAEFMQDKCGWFVMQCINVITLSAAAIQGGLCCGACQFFAELV